MAGLIKRYFPQSKVYFLGRTYTKDVVALSEYVNGFIDYDEIEKQSQEVQISLINSYEADIFLHVFPKKEIAQLINKCHIPWRVGTSSRLYHWLTCNIKFNLSRKNSDHHEAQLNLKLLDFLTIKTDLSLEEIGALYGFTKIPQLGSEALTWIDKTKFNLILHPKSKGSAREWGLDNFKTLIQLLPRDKFKIFISGTAEDGKQLTELISQNKEVIDITGKLSLSQFITFIHHCDGLVAASTGPLHIAAALGKTAIGLFAPMRPIHPGRWQAVGENAHFLVLGKSCSDCRKNQNCHCIREIKPKQVIDLLNSK